MNKHFGPCRAVVTMIALVVAAPSIASAQDRVQIILRAFIPSSYPGASDVLVPVPGAPGHVMVRARSPKGGVLCFESDNRSFSNSPSASARAAANFMLVAGPSPSVEPTAVADRFKAGSTKRLACATGKLEESATASVKS